MSSQAPLTSIPIQVRLSAVALRGLTQIPIRGKGFHYLAQDTVRGF